ncbi:hypothetical protein HOY82DRAFT_619525 [Tuber indicum]|nr:hypothetical protein HOY82DRAFT_619525 [Tuber indicum]
MLPCNLGCLPIKTTPFFFTTASRAAELKKARERGAELGWSTEKVDSLYTQLEEYRERERREARLKELNGLLLREVSSLKLLLTEARGEVEGARKELEVERGLLRVERGKVKRWVKGTREFVPVSPEPTPKPELRRVDGGGMRRGVRVEEGEGKRRCIGEEFGGNGFDPESWRGNWNPVAVKWLVDEKEWEARRKREARSSTMVFREEALYDGAVEDVEARNRVWEVLAGMEEQMKGLKEVVQRPGRSFGNLVEEVRGEVRKLGVKMDGMMSGRDHELMDEGERRRRRAAGMGWGKDFYMWEDSDEEE